MNYLKIVSVTVIAVFLNGCGFNRIHINKSYKDTRVKNITILPQSAGADEKEADELCSSLLSAGFNVIERKHVNSVLEEQKLSLTGLLEKQNYRDIGKLANADAIVMVSVVFMRTNIRVIDVETGAVIASGKAHRGRYGIFSNKLARKLLK